MTVIIPFQNHQPAILGRTHALELLHRVVEPSHDEESDGEGMSDQYAILGKVGLGKITMEGTEQVVDAVVHIRSGLTTRKTIIENAIFPSFATNPVEIFIASQVSPFLFAQSWLLVVSELLAWKRLCHAFECGACAPKRGDVEIQLLVLYQLLQLLAGLGCLFPSLVSQFDGIVGNAGEKMRMDVRFTFTMSDKYDSLRFHHFLSCFSREVVVGGVYSFFLQRAVSPCFGGMLSDIFEQQVVERLLVLILVLMECSLTV